MFFAVAIPGEWAVGNARWCTLQSLQKKRQVICLANACGMFFQLQYRDALLCPTSVDTFDALWISARVSLLQ